MTDTAEQSHSYGEPPQRSIFWRQDMGPIRYPLRSEPRARSLWGLFLALGTTVVVATATAAWGYHQAERVSFLSADLAALSARVGEMDVQLDQLDREQVIAFKDELKALIVHVPKRMADFEQELLQIQEGRERDLRTAASQAEARLAQESAAKFTAFMAEIVKRMQEYESHFCIVPTPGGGIVVPCREPGQQQKKKEARK